MALTQKKISPAKKARLAIVLILVLGITGSVAYFGLIKKPSRPKSAATKSINLQTRTGIRAKTGFDAMKELKDTSILRELRSFGIWPLPSEPKGRNQPFILKQKQE